MDKVKAQVAAAVRRAVMRPDFAADLDVVIDADSIGKASVMPISDLQTRIRVSTGYGSRYFTVILKEDL